MTLLCSSRCSSRVCSCGEVTPFQVEHDSYNGEAEEVVAKSEKKGNLGTKSREKASHVPQTCKLIHSMSEKKAGRRC
jgi:hypothetical protein